MIKKIFGFSLIEMLVALALIAILLLLAAPNLQQLWLQNRVNAGVDQIVSAIHLARSEAIRRQQIVSFCASNNAKICGGQWQDGQIIIVQQTVLRAYPALPTGDTLLWNSSLGKNAALEMLPTGFTNGQQGSFYYCPKDKTAARRIIVEQTGRVRITAESSKCAR